MRVSWVFDRRVVGREARRSSNSRPSNSRFGQTSDVIAGSTRVVITRALVGTIGTEEYFHFASGETRTRFVWYERSTTTFYRRVTTPIRRTQVTTTVHRDISPYSLTGTAGTRITASDFVPTDIGANGSTLLATSGNTVYSINTTSGVATSVIEDSADSVAGDGTYIYLGRDRFVNAFTSSYRSNTERSFVTGDPDNVTDNSGLGWNGTHFFTLERRSRNVKAFTRQGAAYTAGDFTLHADNDRPDGIAWDGTNWFIGNSASNDVRVYVYSATGTYVRRMQLGRPLGTPPSPNSPLAICVDGDTLWAGGRGFTRYRPTERLGRYVEGNWMYAYNKATGSPLEPTSSGLQPAGRRISSHTDRYLYAADIKDGQMYAILRPAGLNTGSGQIYRTSSLTGRYHLSQLFSSGNSIAPDGLVVLD